MENNAKERDLILIELDEETAEFIKSVNGFDEIDGKLVIKDWISEAIKENGPEICKEHYETAQKEADQWKKSYEIAKEFKERNRSAIKS